jgi:hypothetical protein
VVLLLLSLFFCFFFRFFEVIVRFVNIGEIVENITEALLKVALNTIDENSQCEYTTTTTKHYTEIQ